MIDLTNFLAKAKTWPKGHGFNDMHVGQKFVHHWGRTLTQSDNIWFSSATLNFNPRFLNREFASQTAEREIIINPFLVFLTVFGMSVEDLSEAGGAFLGVDDLSFVRSVHPEDTLFARSEVLSMRESKSRADQGIVTWSTKGFNQHDELVIEFQRTNLIAKSIVH